MQTELNNILRQLLDVQLGKLWMGKNYSSRLNKISEEEAFIKPIKNMHSIAELLSHLTAWRKDALVKIETGKGVLTDDTKENWMPVGELKKAGWGKIKTEYEQSLTDLLEILETRDDTFLNRSYYDADYKGEYTYRFLLEGLLHHDIYHLGQLGITIKYLSEK